METIGLIAAMTSESNALLRGVKKWKPTLLGPFRGARFQLNDRDCLLVTSGLGLKRAADATRALLAETTPNLLVSFGIAGAVNADLNIGDVVVASATCLLAKGRSDQVRPLVVLSETARNAVAQVLRPDGARLVIGTAITTRGSQVVPQQLGEMPHPVLEMETSGIAQVAIELGIPLVAIRSVSDGPQSPIPFDLEAALDDDYNFRLGRMIKAILQHPKIILQSRQMMQNSRTAADHAAMAVVAALNQPSAILSLPAEL